MTLRSAVNALLLPDAQDPSRRLPRGLRFRPPRPLPSATWSKDAAAQVDASKLQTDGWRQLLKPDLEQDLRSAGFRILVQPQNAGELHVVIGAWGGSSIDFPVTLDRDGEMIERFSVPLQDLPCVTGTDQPANMRCMAREIAARVLESKLIAAAMARRPAPGAAPEKISGKLAVLELRNFTKDLTRENAQYFTDVVRSAALKAQPQLEVMTRENLLVLLQASGKDLANCEGECEVDTGRRIGADQIVSGEIQKLGTLYKLSLRLHDTREGRLLASTQASGKTVEELDASAQRAAEELLTAR